MEELEDYDVVEKSSLFAGTKFWVASLVPGRKRVINLIETHGGTVVLIERRADVLLTTEKNPLPDSYSFEWVIRCVEAGALVSKERFRVGRDSSRSSRPAGAVERPKATRTAFTADDDRILKDWTRGRLATGGNEMYKALEREYPHHTWQSWRKRFQRLGSTLPDSHFEPREAEAEALASLEALAPSTPAHPTTPKHVARSPGISSNIAIRTSPLARISLQRSGLSNKPTATATPTKPIPTAGQPTTPVEQAKRKQPASAFPARASYSALKPSRKQYPHSSPLAKYSFTAAPPFSTQIHKVSQSPRAAARRAEKREQLRQAISSSMAAITTPSQRQAVSVSSAQMQQPPTTAPGPSPARPSRARSPSLSLEQDDAEYPPQLYEKCKALAKDGDALDAWIRSCVSRGYPRDLAIQALYHTTLTPGALAEVVMDYLGQGSNVPTIYEGIWTKDDDDKLRRFSTVPFHQLPAHEHGPLFSKHGLHNVRMRKNFLKEMDEPM